MTEVFYQPRISGKTTKMIEMSNKLNQTIIVNNRTTANLIAAQAKDMNLIIPHPRDVMDYIRTVDGFNYGDPEPVLIDEAQHVLRKLLKTNVTAMTITDWNDYDVLDDLNDVKNDLADEVALLKQLLTLKDKEIARLNKMSDRLAREDVNE